MAVDAYLQTAAAHLESAAMALKQEAQQARADFMTYDRQVAHDITTKDAERRMFSARASMAPSSEEAGHFLTEAERLKREIDTLKSELEKKRSEMNATVKSKEGEMEGLLSQARSLQSKASSLK